MDQIIYLLIAIQYAETALQASARNAMTVTRSQKNVIMARLVAPCATSYVSTLKELLATVETTELTQIMGKYVMSD